MRRLTLGIFAAIVAGVLFVVLCTFVRRPYETILLVRFGRLIQQNDQVHIGYNWYFKLPTDNVVRMDTRLHLYTGPLQELVTSKREPISVRAFAAWKISDPVAFYQKTYANDETAMSIIDRDMKDFVGSVVARHSLDELFSSDPNSPVKTAEIEDEIAQKVSLGSPEDKIPGLQELGLQVAEVGFSRLAFPPKNAESVYQRMVAALSQQARQYEAEGLKKANEIRADGRAQADKTRAQGVAQAQQIRGQGDAQALQILAKVNQTESAREFYEYWKNLDVLKTLLAKNNIMVLSTQSPLLRNLFQTPVTPAIGASASATRAAAPPANPAGMGTPPQAAQSPAGQPATSLAPLDFPVPSNYFEKP